MHDRIKKIALIGPESTGKTTLCRDLASYFNTSWVPEFARDYISSLDRKYTLDDIIYCAGEQLKSETELLKTAKGMLFCDTETIIAKVWCEDVFGSVPPAIEKMIRASSCDLYLLTLPDIPFQQDDVRENPHRREFFFERYKEELIENKYLFETIGGSGDQRLMNALAAIRKHFPELLKHIAE